MLRSNSHISECRTSHETFFTWRGSVLPATSLWGLYATLILQCNKKTRRAYLILSIALHEKEVAFKRIGIFFWCSSRKKINKYNQSNNRKECFSPFQSISSYTNTAFLKHVFYFKTGLLLLNMRIIFHHFAEKTSVERLELSSSHLFYHTLPHCPLSTSFAFIYRHLP